MGKMVNIRGEVHLVSGRNRTYLKIKTACGKYASIGGSRCKVCYRKDAINHISLNGNSIIPVKKHDHKTYPCKTCGSPIGRENHLCRPCYDKLMHSRAEVRQKEVNRRKEANANRVKQRDNKPSKADVCTKSPNGKHFELINSDKIGECKYCHRIRDYNKLQEDISW